MPTVICDAFAKTRDPPTGFNAASNPEGVINTRKGTSRGLDLNREVLDNRRTSYQPYLKGWQQQEDAQKLTQLRRTSEGGLQTGYVLFVNGEVERLPVSELATDCVLPEVGVPAMRSQCFVFWKCAALTRTEQGPPDKFEIMVSLFNSIPRDADHTAELWTTVNMKQDNVRDKAVYKLLPGFSLYMGLMAKNFTLENRTESRWAVQPARLLHAARQTHTLPMAAGTGTCSLSATCRPPAAPTTQRVSTTWSATRQRIPTTCRTWGK